MTEKIIDGLSKTMKCEENPTVPDPPVFSEAFADHPPPTRESGQQNKTYGPGTMGLEEEEEWREGGKGNNEYKNKKGEQKEETKMKSKTSWEEKTIEEQETAQSESGAKTALKLIDGNNAANSKNEARNLIGKALEEEPFKRGQKLWALRPKPAPRAFFENLKWLNSEEAVAYLRLPSLGALRNLVYRRQIPCTKLGRLLRFDREELDRFLQSQTRHRRIAV